MALIRRPVALHFRYRVTLVSFHAEAFGNWRNGGILARKGQQLLRGRSPFWQLRVGLDVEAVGMLVEDGVIVAKNFCNFDLGWQMVGGMWWGDVPTYLLLG